MCCTLFSYVYKWLYIRKGHTFACGIIHLILIRKTEQYAADEVCYPLLGKGAGE